MIRYYTYYNYGGYKSLYLGDDKDSNKYRYFLPLLPVYEKKLQDNPKDKALEEKVNEMKSLPLLTVNTVSSKNYYSPEASHIVTHGGYKMIYRTSQGGRRFIALRDIKGDEDEYGREAPFLMLWESDSNADIPMMDALAFYIMRNRVEFERELNELFSYDSLYNGLRFSTGGMNRILYGIKTIAEKEAPERHNLPPKADSYAIKFLILPSNSNPDSVEEELNIRDEAISIYRDVNGNRIRSSKKSQSIDSTSSNNEIEDSKNPIIRDLKGKLEECVTSEVKRVWDSIINGKMNLLHRIEQLEKENDALRSRIEKLESKICDAE